MFPRSHFHSHLIYGCPESAAGKLHCTVQNKSSSVYRHLPFSMLMRKQFPSFCDANSNPNWKSSQFSNRPALSGETEYVGFWTFRMWRASCRGWTRQTWDWNHWGSIGTGQSFGIFLEYGESWLWLGRNCGADFCNDSISSRLYKELPVQEASQDVRISKTILVNGHLISFCISFEGQIAFEKEKEKMEEKVQLWVSFIFLNCSFPDVVSFQSGMDPQ